MNKKELAARYPGLVRFACGIYNLPNRFRIRSHGNRIEAPRAMLKNTRIRIRGKNNTLIIGDFSQLQNVTVQVSGDNNRITLGSWSTFRGTEIYVEQSGNEIFVGDHAHFYGKVELAAMEGTAITLGEDCLCSSNIEIRTGDSHAVLDLKGIRINPSRDVTVGDHVWIGKNVMILKGSEIGSHCIVGAGALVSGRFPEKNCSIAGVPAKILKREVDWSVHHIPVGAPAPDFLTSED